MTPTTWIALYAAVVATAAILWQVYTRLSDRRTVVTVNLESEVTSQGEDGVVATVVNRGFRAVQVVSVVIEGNEDGGGWLRGEQSGQGLGESGRGKRLESLVRHQINNWTIAQSRIDSRHVDRCRASSRLC